MFALEEKCLKQFYSTDFFFVGALLAGPLLTSECLVIQCYIRTSTLYSQSGVVLYITIAWSIKLYLSANAIKLSIELESN